MTMPRFQQPIVWLREHPQAADAMLATAVVAITLAAHLSGDTTVDDRIEIEPAWWTALIVFASSAPLYWRRRAPLITAMIVVAVECYALWIGIGGAAFVSSVIAVYSMGAHSSGRPRTKTVAVLAAIVLLLFLFGWIDGLDLREQFVSTLILFVTAFVVGDNLRRRREHVAGLADRAERAEREQELLAEQRVLAERTRIARDLHDVVAHSVSVIVIQAAAARRNLRSSPDRAEEALTAIELTGREAMNELRGILGVLRTREAGEARQRVPHPDLSQLEALVEGETDVELVLDPRIESASIPATTSLAAYRMLQEALTNVRRHAGPGARAQLSLRLDGHDLVLEVIDDGRGAAADEVASGGGFGLAGMRERAASAGGAMSAGPRAGGGWFVRAHLPLSSAEAMTDAERSLLGVESTS